MDEEQRPVERETTIIQSGERGSGGAIAAVVALVVLALIAFFYFSGYLDKAADEVNVDVNVAAPEIDLPDVKVETPAAPAEPANSN